MNSIPFQNLNTYELEILRLLGCGFGMKQISQMLHLSTDLASMYRSRIEKVLRVKSQSEFIRYVTLLYYIEKEKN